MGQRRRHRIWHPGSSVMFVGLALTVSACGDASTESRASTPPPSASPVISQPERANGYPEAQVTGALSLRRGCLFIGDDLVFWPHGATWDDTAQAVTFQAAPFQDARPVEVGAGFDGAGGYYQGDTDFSWLGEEVGVSIENCRGKTDTDDVVFAYPSMSP